MSLYFKHRLKIIIRRNQYGLDNNKSKRNTVNIEGYPLRNVGDTLGPVIVNWILKKKNIIPGKRVSSTKHLMTVGSIASLGFFNSTIWGSGIVNEAAASIIRRKRLLLNRRFDVRAVRGPLTRKALIGAGYKCPELYGDPAILLPMIYLPNQQKKYSISVVFHYKTNPENVSINQDIFKSLHFIDPKTTDYKFFVDEICSSNLVISSSLHGIIIAETYGIPAVFLNYNMDSQLIKYRDWYESTGRELQYCNSLEEAVHFNTQELPDLENMRERLINSFPYDLWEV